MIHLLPALLVLLMVASCPRRSAEQQSVAVSKAAPPAAQPLLGGDTRAWLGPLGDQADSSRCRARLKLPLTNHADWTESYTSAEFSGSPPKDVLHFDGALVIAARSAQLMVLDAVTGTTLENRDVFLRDESATENQEYLEEVYISPTGRLVANDNVGRVYCFDLPKLTSMWNFRSENVGRGGAGPIVADDTALYTSWGPSGLRHLYALELESGEQLWTYPMAATEGMLGVTYARGGRVLCYAEPNQVRAVRSTDGASPWTVGAAAVIQLAPVDQARGRIHLVLVNESIQCRSLDNGAPLWSYSWSHLLPQSERSRLNRESGRADVTRDPLSLAYTAYCLGEDTTYLALTSGHIVRLGPDGEEVWTAKLDSAIVNMVLFDNALLVSQLYLVPAIQHKEERESLRLSPFDPFNLTRPGWDLPEHGAKDENGKLRRQQAWTRVTALSLDSGAILSAVVPETIALSNFCPAGSNIVYGGDRAGSGARQHRHYITAYNWVEP